MIRFLVRVEGGGRWAADVATARAARIAVETSGAVGGASRASWTSRDVSMLSRRTTCDFRGAVDGAAAEAGNRG